MPPRHNDSRHKQAPKNTPDQFRAELRRNVLAAVNVNVPYNTRRASKAALSTPSTRALAAQLPASRETIRKIINSASTSHSSPLPRGRPALLTAAEDAALAAFILWMEKSGFAAEKSQVEEAALGFLHARGSEKTEISRNWYPRFREPHPELRKTFLKAVDKARKAFEASDLKDINNFFSDLKEVIYDHNIGPSEIWNEDECGIRIGCLRERIQVLWLDMTENRPRFLTLETQRKEHNDVLSQRPKKAFSEAQRQARQAPRPTLAMDQAAWPDSDDEVEFRGLGPFQDDDDDDIDLIGLNDLGGEDVVGLGTPLGITSSPPLEPLKPADDSSDDNLTLPQLPVTTPRMSGYQRIKNVMRQLREQQATEAARATSS
ncbi:hypothetical protein EDB81DRAFT_794223 [Dactylonectria macrodidyma]|uniref:HTH CENPB-type domain-containing protein n=1 Tax=Dactylonectria macrodidyma TaxID=307937 RepID=A0A9P9EVY8_9HYPO|nr:hypothetical protein EDB81DRAFT_794223 [Dactylonectria macrodidyma]